MALNDTSIKALKAKPAPYKVFDGEGLYLEVLTSGSKVWRVKTKLEGKDKRITLGHYPIITLKDARGKMQEVKTSIAKGTFTSLREESESGAPFEKIAEEWRERKRPAWENEHYQTVGYRLDRFVYPHIGKQNIAEVTPVDILKFIRLIENKGKNHTAHRVLGIVSQVFRYGVAIGKCPSDPCRDLSGALTSYTEKPRAAIVTRDGVAELMKRIAVYKSPVMRYLLFWSAYTFCRPGEVREAEWNEIDLEAKEWRIPAQKMKMRFEHRVPLPTQCLTILGKLQAMKLSDRWIFPSTKNRHQPISEAGALSAIRNMGYTKEEMTPHGFRAMASTLLNEMGFEPDVIERQLAHGDTDKIRAVYNRAAYMDRRCVMMQEWADYLDQLRENY